MPAVKGGAVETLLQTFIDKNESQQDFSLTVISSSDNNALEKSFEYNETEFIYLNNQKKSDEIKRMCKKIYRKAILTCFNKSRSTMIYPEMVKKAQEKIKENNYDKVLIISIPEVTLQIRKYFEGEIILYLHNDYLNKTTYNKSSIVNACDNIFAISEYIKFRVLSIDGSIESKIKVINNGCDLKKYTPLMIQERNNIRKKIGISPQDVVVVFSGRLSETKGIYELITAFNRINLNNLKLLVIGGYFYSNDKKNKFIRKLEKKAENGLDNILFTGYVSSSEIPYLLMSSDIGVVPSIFEEPSGLSVLEAQAAGLPLITTRVGGIPEIVSEENSILLDIKDEFVDNLQHSIEILALNKKLRKQMGESGKNFVKQYSNENYYEYLKNAIKNEMWYNKKVDPVNNQVVLFDHLNQQIFEDQLKNVPWTLGVSVSPSVEKVINSYEPFTLQGFSFINNLTATSFNSEVSWEKMTP